MATTEQAKQFLQDAIHNNCLFTLRHAACTPLLNIETCDAEKVADDLYKVTAVVANHGFLPTYMTERALKHQSAEPIKVTLEGDAELIMGETPHDLGHLAGRDERRATWSPMVTAMGTNTQESRMACPCIVRQQIDYYSTS